MGDEITERDVESFGAKLDSFAESLPPREQAMLAELLSVASSEEDDDEVAGFNMGIGIDLGLNSLIGGTVLGSRETTEQPWNRWNRTIAPPVPPWKRWNRTS